MDTTIITCDTCLTPIADSDADAWLLRQGGFWGTVQHDFCSLDCLKRGLAHLSADAT